MESWPLTKQIDTNGNPIDLQYVYLHLKGDKNLVRANIERINGLTEVDMQIYESELKRPWLRDWEYTSLMSLDKDLLNQIIKKETVKELRTVIQGSFRIFNFY